MSEFAIKVKGYYDDGLWSLSRVEKALELKKITQEEFDNITKPPAILPDDHEVEQEVVDTPTLLPDDYEVETEEDGSAEVLPEEHPEEE